MEESREEFEHVRERISSLQDSSIVAALRGLSEKISSQRSKQGSKRPSADDDLSRLLVSFVSLLDRISRVHSGGLRSVLNNHVRDTLLHDIPWVVDILLRKYFHELQRQEGAIHVVCDAMEADGTENACAEVYSKVLKALGRNPGQYQKEDSALLRILMQRVIGRLKKSTDASSCCCAWWANALELASLPLRDSRFEASVDILQDQYATFLPTVEKLSHKLMNPDWIVTCIAGGIDARHSLDRETVGEHLDSTVACVEIVVQILVSILYAIDADERPSVGSAKWVEVQNVISKLLTVCWELGQFARAIGYTQKHVVQWNVDVGIRLLPFCVSNADENMLLMTPPQITLILDMISRQGKSQRSRELDEESMSLLELLGPLFKVSVEGLFHPKTVLSAKATEMFANLAQRTRVRFSQDARFETILSQKDAQEPVVKLECEKRDVISEHDQDVDELLAMITAKDAHERDATMQKKPRKIQSERLDDKPSNESQSIGTVQAVEKPHVSSYHHKGRVIMPATYNLDSETREILWQAYIEDKDKLVDMLGDSNYHQWHDETQRPASRRKSGMEVAFNAIFGESTAPNDAEFELKNGVIVDDTSKSLIDVSLLFPWQSLISGVLILTSHVASSVPQEGDKSRILCRLVASKERKEAVSRALKLVHPDYSRSIWKNCCTIVDRFPTIGCLLYVSLQCHTIAMHTTRHSIDTMIAAFFEILHGCNSISTKQSRALPPQNKSAIHPLDLVQDMLRSCMAFPPLLGSAINSISAKYIPELCGLGEETDVVCYTSSCCWVIWQSLQGKKREAFWLTEQHADMWSHPVSTARIPAKHEFLTSSLALISKKIEEIHEESSNILSALQASSSLCATLCVDICSKFSRVYDSSSIEPGIYHICQQKKFNLSILSVISALCEIYCGLAEDWEEVVLGIWDESNDGLPDAGSIVIGMDVAESCQAYLSVLNAPGKIQGIPDTLVAPVQTIANETAKRMTIIMESIQKLDKKSAIYQEAIKEIENTPDIIITDKDSNRHSKSTGVAKGKTVKDIRNPFVRAIVQEYGRKESDALDEDVSDLEDFIVADPERDYDEFIADHFPLDQSSNDSAADDDG